jgi:hypothetical protein
LRDLFNGDNRIFAVTGKKDCDLLVNTFHINL